jgi:cytosine/adenosine deaminase-related metal-dependent hydrolase
VSSNPATALERPQSRLRPGDPADFTLLRAETLAEALVTAPTHRVVIRAGHVVARDGRLLDDKTRGTTTGTRDTWRTELSEA